MRRKQFIFLNGIMIISLVIILGLSRIFMISTTVYFLILGILMMIQGIFRLLKGSSTKSFIPIVEQVAIYEKNKLGNEWNKMRKTGYISCLLASGFILFQAYFNRGSESFSKLDWPILIIVIFLYVAMINVSLLFHIKKVDGSSSNLEIKGLTWKTSIRALFIAILFTFLVFGVTLFYLIKPHH